MADDEGDNSTSPPPARRRIVPQDVLAPVHQHPSRIREHARTLARNPEAIDEVRYLAAMIEALCIHIARVELLAQSAASRARREF